MAFFIENDTVYITKGDDAVLEIANITADNGDRYELQSADVLTLTVRSLPTALLPALIQIDGIGGSNRIVIRHADTANLDVGRYSADVQLTTADGKRHTIWPILHGNLRYEAKSFNNFVIMPEVTTK